MKRSLFIAFTILAISPYTTFGQKKQKEVKYEKLYYKNITTESDIVQLEVVDAVSVAGETKFKLKITNKTKEYVLYKPEESKFIVNGNEIKPTEKWMIINPYSTESKVINAPGPKMNEVKSYTFQADGFYSLVPETGKITADNFKLPASSNDFKAGPFDGSMSKLLKESDATLVKFKFTYNGNKFGIIYPAKAAVKMPDGNEYANGDTKAKPVILKKGESDNSTLKWDRMEGGRSMDMQLVEMNIVWTGVFEEADPVKDKGLTLQMEWDEALTDAKK